jgi:superfamily II DNA or RNA helicase
MQNKKLFGEVVYQVSFKTLVERGIITPVKLHVMYAEGIRADGVLIANKKVADDHDRESNYDAVKEIVKVQAANTPFNEKILVVCKDVAEVKYLAKSFKNDSEFKGYTIFHISASGGNVVNGKKVSRGEFLSMLNTCSGKALIFHYDILSEGIDVDGISGVILLRATGVAKTLQTIGRAVRVLKTDRELSIEQRVKQHAWVSVPVVLSMDTNSEDYESIKQSLLDILTALAMGGVPHEIVTTHAPRGEPDDLVEHDPLALPEELQTKFSELFDLTAVQHKAHEIVVDQENKEFVIMVKNLETLDDFFAALDEELLAQ